MSLLALLLSVPLSQRPIQELSDAELCQAARDMIASPVAAIEDVDPIHFHQWAVDCDARLLRINASVTDARVDERMFSVVFTRPPFCTEPNLVEFWGRGWHFELRVRFTDGTVRDFRPCE